MEILENQTLYQCDYCNKRLLSKKGCVLHENEYCWKEKSPHQKRLANEIARKQRECSHENRDTVYTYIPGEAVQQPDHDECLDCGAKGCERRRK